MNSIVEITDGNFETEVLKSSQPVLVDFWAPWCGPCKMLTPVLEEIAKEEAGRVKVVKVNLDDHQDLAARYRVQAIPTLLYFSKGEIRHQTVGVVSKKQILSRLSELTAPAGSQAK
jgi:thioredoxin 1